MKFNRTGLEGHYKCTANHWESLRCGVTSVNTQLGDFDVLLQSIVELNRGSCDIIFDSQPDKHNFWEST